MKRILIVSAAMAAVMMLTGCSTTVTGIDVPESMTVEVGQAVDLAVNYTYKNENASDEKKAAAQSEAGVKLTSDSPAVTVAEDGTLTAAQGGEAIITVTSADGTLSDTCKVTVTVPLTGIALDQETLALAINGTESAKLTAAPVPVESTEPVDGVAYTSSNEAVATVAEDGTVTAVADGEAEITATLGEYTASCKVTVTTAPDGIKFGKASGSLTVGGSTTLKLYTTPSEAAAPDMSQVTFTSSDEDVATVDGEGKVTAKKAGKATITATYNGLTAEYTLTVNNKAAAPAGGSTAASGNGAAPSTNNGSSAPSTGGNTPSAGGSSGGTTPAPAPEQSAPAPDNGGSSGNDLPIINPGDEWDGSNAIIGGSADPNDDIGDGTLDPDALV